MRFGTILFTAIAALATSVSAAALTRTQVVGTFKEITDLSDNLRIEVSRINLLNAPIQGYKIARGFAVIIDKVSKANAMISTVDPVPFSRADANLIVVALTKFVRVHQALLNVVIGKHGLLTLIPFFEPIRVALVNLEVVVDTFAFYLIGFIPTATKEANEQFGALSITLKVAISTYEQPI